MSRGRHERDYERGRERDSDRSKDYDRERDRDRDRARSRERGRDRGRDREVSRDYDSGRQRRERESRHGAAETGFGKQARSQSPRPRHRGEGARESQFSDSGREAIISPPQAAAVANEDMIDAASDLTSAADSVARMQAAEAALEAKEKDKAQPTFEYSGKLAAETNKVKGVTLQFTEPPEARKPSKRWRLYVFKDGEALNEPLYIHRQTCYLFGRERRVADIPTDHPSCSKQHAVIQYRLTEKEGADGMMESKVRPYIMDLGSTNGTFLNAERIDAQRYYELFETDTIKFGNSSREYVVLHENSTGAGL